MKELVLQVIQQLDVENSELEFTQSYHLLGPLGEFIAKAYGQWLQEERARLYAFNSIEHAISVSGNMPVSGRLAALSHQQREQIADLVCEMWVRIPLTYQFVFPLPVVGLSPDEVIEITPGIAIKHSPRDMVDAMGMHLSHTLGGLLGTQYPPVASLVVEAKGLMQYSMPAEVPAASAVRAAKVVIQLGLVEKLFDRSSWLSQAAPKESKYTPRIGLSPNTGTVELPATFATVLAEIGMPSEGGANCALRFAPIGTVLRLEAELELNAKAKPTKTKEIYARQIQQHCARIATAAEWLFDAEHEPESATTIVQTAIAFEALYGGGKGDPVVQTLANRLAYALGKTPQQREFLRERFTEFYDIRSDVVHIGASRLTAEQRKLLQFIRRSVLYDALKHELDLLKTAFS